MNTIQQEPQLSWDRGTAYDLWMSLMVLNKPEIFGVRAAWAAGMRARLPHEARAAIERGAMISGLAPAMLPDLPGSKDAASVLQHLNTLDPLELMETLTNVRNPLIRDLMHGIVARGEWNDVDVSALASAMQLKEKPTRETVGLVFDLWLDAEAFGADYLAALHSYYELFFADEERRILPALETALQRAQELAARLPVAQLLEELSQGVNWEPYRDSSRLILAPSYWATPVLVMTPLDQNRTLIIFGARPLEASLDAGEAVPDTLVNLLKALADPTRLSILRYLSDEPLLPTQLSKRLRLRSATVSHHLKILRLAGLVRMRVTQGNERLYSARPEAVEAGFAALRAFLKT
jgi:DNA-binding transcriptional ArsR family regulator